MSQLTQIRQHLKSGKSISPLMALRLFGCLRLSARIQNLRDEGMNIKTEMYYSKEYRYAKYKLVK